MPPCFVITQFQLTSLSADAAASPRRRKNLNLHQQLADPIQRLFNAMEPGTYVRPHRHARGTGWELMLAIRGVFSLLAFDDHGRVLARYHLNADADTCAIEVPAFTWHAAVVHAPGTIMFEVKPGPYQSLDDKDFASWAPSETDPESGSFVEWYEKAEVGALPPTWSRSSGP